MKYLTNSGLSYFFNKIKTYIASQLNSKANLTHTHSASDITSGLSAVATSGSYNDLSNKPTIPSKTSDLTNDSGFLTSHQDLSGYVPRSGGAVMTGDNLARTVDNNLLKLCGGAKDLNGGTVALYGKDAPTLAGTVVLQPSLSSSSFYNFILYPDGTATWGRKHLAMQEDTVPRSGGAVITGEALGRNVDDDNLRILGGSTWNTGAQLQLCGKDLSGGLGGTFTLYANSGNVVCALQGTPSGILTWNNKNVAMYEDVVPRSGGSVMTGTLIGRIDNTSEFLLCGGGDWWGGGAIILYGKNRSAYPGAFAIHAYTDVEGDRVLNGYANGTLTWNGQPIQTSSDKRLKQQISEIDDKLLDAWEDVNLVQFKYNDAVDQKGDTARLHTGYVVQQIEEACKSHNLDISAYGLYCHEEYPERTEEVTIENEDGTTTKETRVIEEASEHYSLRYTETLVVECAYLRKQIKELKERLEKLEGNSK